MKLRIVLGWCTALGALLVMAACSQTNKSVSLPHLERQGTALRMIVDDKPFLMIGGELHNSSASSLEYLKPIWPRLAAMHLNTVLTPIYWELLEPQEGKFDFSLVDGQIEQARQSNQRIVFLWFGSWKNGMSSYIPTWVKSNQDRFPRVEETGGHSVEILSTFSDANRDADTKAFVALMQHIKQVDSQRTVIMMQVENEVGVLGDSRDRSDAANKAFASPVPPQLMDYLQQHKDSLAPELTKLWATSNFKTAGTWEEVFGKSLSTDEAFMAYNYARYIEHVTAAGRAEYNIPMITNVWLSGPDRKPGDWPSGCPEPQVLDIWMATAPHLDAFAPDIYSADFVGMANRYHRDRNPFFIVETSARPGEGNVFYAFGQHGATCFSPFAIDSVGRPRDGGEMTPPGQLGLTHSYEIITELAPLILENMGKNTMAGVSLTAESEPQVVQLGDYKLEVSWPRMRFAPPPPPATAAGGAAAAPPAPPSPMAFMTAARSGALFISSGPNEYFVAGNGPIRVTFSPATPGPPIAGIAYVEEGNFVNGQWVAGRRLNGDENGQGKYVRIDGPGGFGNNGHIQRVVLYRYH
jgi:Domain of unknown function (DUF5597)/Beta-galactosidase